MKQKMSEKYLADRPREKLRRLGPAALSDLELLQAMVGSGNAQADVLTISRHLLDLFNQHDPEIDYAQLSQIMGLGPTKICNILAAFELAQRYLQPSVQPVIDSPESAVAQFANIRHKAQEYLALLTLDGANRLIQRHIVSIGTLTASLVHPREIFAPAIADRAAAVILAHNHPSGNLTPSAADRATTTRIQQVGELVGIPLSDHIIVTKNDWRSIL